MLHHRSASPVLRCGTCLSYPHSVNNEQEVAGVLEILADGYGFLRSPENCYMPSASDPHVPRQVIKRFGLSEGSFVVGTAVLEARKNKSARLESVGTVDGMSPDDYKSRRSFTKLTSLDPYERFRIDETGDTSMRILDLLAPIGKGQRGLIVASPRTGKTMLLQKLAHAIADLHPEVHLMVVLIDERPEEVTEMRRTVRGEVIFSSSDTLAKNHVKVAEIVLERARRLVESGQDVVVLLDSITRMARAYNVEHRGTGRTMSGGLGAGSMAKPREFFGAARKAEEGGSLTIIATALVDTGSRMDQVIFEEFKGTGNMELVLDRELAERRIWPAIDIAASGTRKEEKLRTPEVQKRVNTLRRTLSQLSPDRAMQALIKKVDETKDNRQFLGLMDTGKPAGI